MADPPTKPPPTKPRPPVVPDPPIDVPEAEPFDVGSFYKESGGFYVWRPSQPPAHDIVAGAFAVVGRTNLVPSPEAWSTGHRYYHYIITPSPWDDWRRYLRVQSASWEDVPNRLVHDQPDRYLALISAIAKDVVLQLARERLVMPPLGAAQPSATAGTIQLETVRMIVDVVVTALAAIPATQSLFRPPETAASALSAQQRTKHPGQQQKRPRTRNRK